MYFFSFIDIVFFWGVSNFGSVLGIGVLFCLFAWGGSSVLPNFQGLEVGSYSHHRVVGGDQSLNIFSRVKLIG